MNEVFYYIAMVLFLAGAILYYLAVKNAYNNKNSLDEKTLLFKKSLSFAGFFALILVSLIIFTVVFYTSESTINYLETASIKLNPGRLFMSYFFLVLFIVFVFTFLTSFIYIFYFKQVTSDKTKKILKWIMYGSIPLMAVSFILMSEGNAPYLQYPLCNSLYIGIHGIKFINSYTKPAPFYTDKGVLDGGIIIAFYAIFILSGALLVLGICDHFVYKFYGKHGLLTTCFYIAFPMGIIGARLWYVLLDISKNGEMSSYVLEWTNIFRIQDGGLGIMGGAILGIIAGVTVMLTLKYWKKDPVYRHMSYLRIVDICVPAILIAQGIGRTGNFFNCEVHGAEIPYEALNFLPTFIQNNYQFSYAYQADPGKVYLPLALIESITNLIGYFVIYFGFVRGFKKYHAPGAGVGMYLIWYGLTRVLLEPLRAGTFEYNMSYYSAYGMVGLGVLICIFFVVWRILVVKKLWFYKTREYIDSIIIDDSISKEKMIRNAIILAVSLIIIVVGISVLMNIW